MNKQLNWIVLALFCANFIACDDQSKTYVKTDYEKLNLNGKIKSISETYYLPVISDDSIKRGEQTSAVPSFFESGEDVSEEISSHESVLYFNLDGNIAECTLIDSVEDFYFKEKFDYDKNILTNKVGILSEEFFYKQIFKYDSQNRETLREFYDAKEKLFESVSTDYIDKNNVVEKISANNGEMTFERKILMENGLPMSSVRFENLDKVESWTGKYDSEGRIMLSELYDPDGSLTLTTKYEYDNFGNETKRTIFSGEDEPVIEYIYMYKYDEFENWIQRASITDNSPDIIIVRQITYYK